MSSCYLEIENRYICCMSCMVCGLIHNFVICPQEKTTWGRLQINNNWKVVKHFIYFRQSKPSHLRTRFNFVYHFQIKFNIICFFCALLVFKWRYSSFIVSNVYWIIVTSRYILYNYHIFQRNTRFSIWICVLSISLQFNFAVL